MSIDFHDPLLLPYDSAREVYLQSNRSDLGRFVLRLHRQRDELLDRRNALAGELFGLERSSAMWKAAATALLVVLVVLAWRRLRRRR